jgi:uncharacterized membrane protein
MTDQPEVPRDAVPQGWAPVQPPAYPPAPPWGGAPQPVGPPPQQGWGPANPGWTPSPQAWGAANPGWTPPPKPGVIPLQPLSVGEILDGAISSLRAHPGTMLGFSALVAVATQVVLVPLTWLLLGDTNATQVGETATVSDDINLITSSLSAGAVSVVVTAIATLLLTGMLTVVVSRAVLGQTISTAEAWRQARPRLPQLFGVAVLVFLLLVGTAVVTLGIGTLLAVSGAPAGVVFLAFLLGVPAFIVAVAYLYVSLALAPAVVVLERQGVAASLRRSRALVKGAWWRTFGILVLVFFIAQVVSGVVSVPFGIISFVAGGSDHPYSLLPLLTAAVATIIGAAITWPFTAAASALLYVDRRMRREGLDLELTRAAGLAPSGQSPTPGAPPTGPG